MLPPVLDMVMRRLRAKLPQLRKSDEAKLLRELEAMNGDPRLDAIVDDMKIMGITTPPTDGPCACCGK